MRGLNRQLAFGSFQTRLIAVVLILLSLFCLSTRAFSQPANGVEGTWLTIDDKTNTPRSIIDLQINNGQLQGVIEKLYLRKGEKDTDVCTKCTQPVFKDKPILGMTVLWGLKQENFRKWKDGYIIDPTSGEIYHCQLTLSPNGQELIVRGYIGFALLGRSQRWVRVEQQ